MGFGPEWALLLLLLILQKTVLGTSPASPLATEDVRLGTLRMVREAKSTGGNREGAAQMLLSHSSEGED